MAKDNIIHTFTPVEALDQNIIDENTSLLHRNGSDVAVEASLRNEVVYLLRSTTPISAGYLLQNSVQLASILIIGRLGALELSVAASGFMITTCTGWLLAVGGTTALDALGSRAFTSDAGNPCAVGVLTQRCLLVVTALYIPVVVFWCFIGPLLVACGQSPELAYGTQQFLRYLSPFGLGYIYFETLKKFLQCQNIQTPGTIVLLLVALLNIPTCYVVVHRFQFGMIGGVIATGSMYWLACGLIALYICCINGKQAWSKPSKEVFKDIGAFSRLVGFGLMMVGAEWWAFELIAVAAGAMGQIPVAAQSIMMTVDSVFALVPFGLGVASSNRLGHLIGLHEFEQLRLTARAASCIAVANGCLTMTVILILREHIAKAFSDDAAVVALAVNVFPWGAAFQVFDNLQAANSGVLRGLGRANIGATVNLVAYYICAIPVGLLVGFYFNWGLHGLWLGLTLALGLVGLGEFSLVNFIPWTKFVDFDEAKVATEGENSPM